MKIFTFSLSIFNAGIFFGIWSSSQTSRDYKWKQIITPFFTGGFKPILGLDLFYGRALIIIELPFSILRNKDKEKLRAPFR